MSDESGAAGGASPKKADVGLPSLDLAFGLTSDRLAAQITYAGDLDTKANFVLGAASLLIAAATALHGVVLASLSSLTVKVIAVVAVALYILVVITALLAYAVRTYKVVPKPSDLKDYYLTLPEPVTKEILLNTMVTAYKQNDVTISRKAGWTKAALAFFAGEVLMLAIIALIQVFS